MDARWEWPCEVRMLMQGDFCMVEGTTQQTMWGGHKVKMATWGEIYKVTSHPCEKNFATLHPCKMPKLSHMDARWLWVDVTLAMYKAQMKNNCISFPLYTFAKSPCIHVKQLCHPTHMRWDLQSHLMSTWDNFATLHPHKMPICLAWMQGDFAKVTSWQCPKYKWWIFP